MAGWYHTLFVCVCVILPFPYYFLLWRYPQQWVRLCGSGVDPCRGMAGVSHLLKLMQVMAVLSVARFSWPPWYFLLLFFGGQFLNFRVYHLLGEDGVYYGVRFGKAIPWISSFPYGFLQHPQYVGSVLSLLGCLCWIPCYIVLLWCSGYLFMILLEQNEDISTRAKLQHS